MAYRLNITNKRPEMNPDRVHHSGTPEWVCLACGKVVVASAKPKACKCGGKYQAKK